VPSSPGDTDPEAARVQLELLRAASPGQRLRLAFSLSRTAMGLARAGLARAFPEASPEEIALRFVALNYGPELAHELREYVARTRAADEPGQDGRP
jgi:hypothetical protein